MSSARASLPAKEFPSTPNSEFCGIDGDHPQSPEVETLALVALAAFQGGPAGLLRFDPGGPAAQAFKLRARLGRHDQNFSSGQCAELRTLKYFALPSQVQPMAEQAGIAGSKAGQVWQWWTTRSWMATWQREGGVELVTIAASAISNGVGVCRFILHGSRCVVLFACLLHEGVANGGGCRGGPPFALSLATTKGEVNMRMRRRIRGRANRVQWWSLCVKIVRVRNLGMVPLVAAKGKVIKWKSETST